MRWHLGNTSYTFYTYTFGKPVFFFLLNGTAIVRNMHLWCILCVEKWNEKCTKYSLPMPKKKMALTHLVSFGGLHKKRHIANLPAKRALIWQTEASVACGGTTHRLTRPLCAGFVTHTAVGRHSVLQTALVAKHTNPVWLVALAQTAEPSWLDSRQWGWGQNCWQAVPSSLLPSSGGRLLGIFFTEYTSYSALHNRQWQKRQFIYYICMQTGKCKN